MKKLTFQNNDNSILSLRDVNRCLNVLNVFNSIVEKNIVNEKYIILNSDIEKLCQYVSNYETLKIKDTYKNNKDNTFKVIEKIVNSYSETLKVNYFNLGFIVF